MYTWYCQGWLSGELGIDTYKIARNLLNTAKWSGDEMVLGDFWEEEDNFATRYVEGRHNVYHVPDTAHRLSWHFWRNTPAMDLHRTMVNPMYHKSYWQKHIQLVDVAAWNSKSEQPWHSDYGPFDIQVLMYFTNDLQTRFTQSEVVGGDLVIGNKDNEGLVTEVYRHVPNDGSFVILQPNNPYFLHRVEKSAGNRQVIELRYKIDG